MLRVDYKKCTGCTACISACPKKCLEMREGEGGFQFPMPSGAAVCIGCGLCNQACPIFTPHPHLTEDTRAYAVYSQDTAERLESSSGGVFSLFARDVLSAGGIVYGAAYDRNFRVHHIAVTETSDLYRLRGAKYAQSDMNGIFSDVQKKLMENRHVLFTGTPCQVSGLKTFLNREYENLITIDFVCHGVPSPAAWSAYVKYRAKLDNKGVLPTTINLRSKSTGWSQYAYSILFEYADGEKYSVESGHDLFMQLFVGDYINRKSCEDCQFKGYERQSDLTLGDFWGIWEVDSEMDDNKGTSLVLTHSQKGEKAFKSVYNRSKVKEVSLEDVSRFNPSMLTSSTGRAERDGVLAKIRAGSFDAVSNIFDSHSRFSRVKDKMKRILKKLK